MQEARYKEKLLYNSSYVKYLEEADSQSQKRKLEVTRGWGKGGMENYSFNGTEFVG